MRKDIKIPEVKNVQIAIVKEDEESWKVYIINNNNTDINDTLVVTRGYGQRDGNAIQTSTLRHYIGTVKAKSYSAVERMDPELFDLSHEFWVTFYIKENIYDKKFIFRTESLSEKNLSYIKELDAEGIIHTS
ncbi:MAG: hypothetical protein ACNS60_02560 [Candidatus Cyclobacteriaceae bacterium M2_1C_046]